MKDVITVATMRESDAHTIALYVPSRELMYRAAMGVYQAVNWQGKKVAILTGSGNNGGDGYALAGILADHSVPCCLYQVSGRYSEDGKYYYDQAVEKGVERKQFSEGEDLSRYDILVDCLLGTGFSGPVRGAFQQAIQAINRAKAYVVSVDINSGMNGDTGKGDLVVRSDLTVTIGYLKGRPAGGGGHWDSPGAGGFLPGHAGGNGLSPQWSVSSEQPSYDDDPGRGGERLQKRADHS